MSSHPTTGRWSLLSVVAALVLGEALLLLAGAGYLVHGLLTDVATDAVAAVFLVLTALLFAAGLVFCARGLWRGAAWARSPLIVWQVLQLAAGLPAFSGGTAWAGVLIGLPAALVLLGLLASARQPRPDR